MTITRNKLQELYDEFYGTTHNLLSKQNTQVYWSKGKPTTLLLDELNRAQPDVKQSALQLVLEKEIHQHSLPYYRGKPTLIMACVNPADENYQVQELDPALNDRFLTITVEADAESWVRYARSEGVINPILSFITNNPDRIVASVKGVQDSKTPTPRAWQKLSDLIKVIPNPKESPFLLNIIKGKIGESTGILFYTFFTQYDDQLTYDSIVEFINDQEANSIEELGEKVKEYISSQNSMFKTSMLELFCDKQLIKGATLSSALGAMAMLHAVELEIRGSFMKKLSLQRGDIFKILLSLDKDKVLIRSITDHIEW
jgi:hypothetical protein